MLVECDADGESGMKMTGDECLARVVSLLRSRIRYKRLYGIPKLNQKNGNDA